jgi:hypothetical protein
MLALVVLESEKIQRSGGSPRGRGVRRRTAIGELNVDIGESTRAARSRMPIADVVSLLCFLEVRIPSGIRDVLEQAEDASSRGAARGARNRSLQVPLLEARARSQA